MNYLDIFILGVIAAGVFWGVSKGFVKSFAGVTGFFAALFIATTMVGIAAQFIQDYLNFSKGVAYVIGYIVLFFGVLLVFKVIAQMIVKLFEVTSTRWLDRAGGALCGFLISSFVLSVLFSFLSFFSFTDRMLPERDKSLTYPYAINFIPWITNISSKVLPTAMTFQDVSAEILSEKPKDILEDTEAGRKLLEYLEKLKTKSDR